MRCSASPLARGAFRTSVTGFLSATSEFGWHIGRTRPGRASGHNGRRHTVSMRTAVGMACLLAMTSCGYAPESASDIGRDIECTGYESTPAPRPALEAGTCRSYYNGSVTIFYFADNSDRDKLVNRGLADPRVAHAYLVGEHFAIDGPPDSLIEMRQVIEG